MSAPRDRGPLFGIGPTGRAVEERRCGAALSFDADFTAAGFALWRAAR